MKLENKYFISPIPLDGHDLMKPLTKKLSRKGYKLIYKKQKLSIKNLLKKRFYFSAIKELISRFFYEIFWNIYLTLFILIKKNSRIMIAWPQVLGLQIIFKAIQQNKVILYIMDNSFFCIRSYNTNPVTNQECLDCLGSINPHKLCSSFPKKYEKKKNIKYLELLKNSSEKIIFYSQNKLQKSLLIKHFGNKTKVKIVGMNIEEKKKSQEIIKSEHTTFDIVFHGRSIIAKGLIYILRLAEYLPNQTFLIPESKANILNIIEKKIILSNNITFKQMNWEDGLKEAVISARLVINPSMWSAPIEGALVKSAIYNENVATDETMYGYEKETKLIKNHIRLSKDLAVATKQLKFFFKSI